MENDPTKTIHVSQLKKIKRSAVHRFIDKQSNTPFYLNARLGGPDKDAYYLSPTNSNWVVENYEKHVRQRFYKEHQAIVPGFLKKAKELEEYAQDTREEQIQNFAKPEAEIIAMMSELGEPVLCIHFDSARKACELAEALVLKELLNHFQNYIPNGQTLAKDADLKFEEICASLKIPRRTRAIITAQSFQK